VVNELGHSVSDAVRARVQRAVAELGYAPNIHARAIAGARSSLVGLLVRDLVDPYFSGIADGVIHTADGRGLFVMLGSTSHEPARELSAFNTLRAQRVHAIVLVGTATTRRSVERPIRDAIAAFRDEGGRIACVSERRFGTHVVVPANRSGAKALAGALADAGHRSFAILPGPAHLLAARDRAAGFRAGLAHCGIEPPIEVSPSAGFDRDGGYDAVARLTKGQLRGRCIFAVNDLMALGALAALRERGLRVPEDVAVAGFGAISTLRDLVPSLTTVSLPLRAMGETALALALDVRTPKAVAAGWEVQLHDSTRRN
jgi:LacI family transcriptional regulator